MERRKFAGAIVVALGLILGGTAGRSQSRPPTEGAAVGATPGWFLQASFPDPTGRAVVEPGGGVTIPPRSGGGAQAAGAAGPM